MNTAPKLICLAGISGSGKSCYANDLADNIGAVVVSSDAVRKQVTGSSSDMSQDHLVWEEILPELVVESLKHSTVIFDATGVTKSARALVVKWARLAGKPVECHYFEPKLERAKRQNKQRDRHVPEFVIDKQAAKFVTPSIKEGFTVVINLDKE